MRNAETMRGWVTDTNRTLGDCIIHVMALIFPSCKDESRTIAEKPAHTTRLTRRGHVRGRLIYQGLATRESDVAAGKQVEMVELAPDRSRRGRSVGAGKSFHLMTHTDGHG